MGPPKSEDVSLKDHFEQRQAANERLADERWKAHQEVHTMGQRAIDAALVTLNIRLEGMNEFRAQILKERTEFLKTQVYDVEHKALEGKVDSQQKWQDNMSGRLWMLGTFILAINVLVGFVLRLWGK
jgi:hypothetical protein